MIGAINLEDHHGFITKIEKIVFLTHGNIGGFMSRKAGALTFNVHFGQTGEQGNLLIAIVLMYRR